MLDDAIDRYYCGRLERHVKARTVPLGKRVCLAKSRVDPIAHCQRSLDSYLQKILHRANVTLLNYPVALVDHKWQRESEPRALAYLTFDPDSSAMEFDKLS